MEITRKINWFVSERTRLVILLFVLLTGVFLVGATQISSDSGTNQFTEDIPSQEALESINNEFSQRSLGRSALGQTTVIHTRDNSLSKNALLQMSKFEETVAEKDNLRVEDISSVSSAVAEEIDSTASSEEDHTEVLRKSTQEEIESATVKVIESRFESSVSDDYNKESVKASATIGTIQHSGRVSSGGGSSDGPGVGDTGSLEDVQLEIQSISQETTNSIIISGAGIQSSELAGVSQDSLSIILPVAITFILLFLGVAYRDPFDIVLALISLITTVIWTFGFMGLVGIPFTQILASVPVLLLAVGIDFGIHSVNRYREEKENSNPRSAMARANRQLLVAFGIVTGSTAIGFGANITSPLPPIQQFGIVTAIGIVFTFLTFGIFLPAMKLELDSIREKYSIPEFANSPLGNEDSILGKILLVSAFISERAPRIFIVIILIFSIGIAGYGTGVESEFSNDLFLPPAELPAYVDFFPVDIDEYQTPKTNNLIEDNFETYGQTSLIFYITGDMREASTLEKIGRLSQSPPDVIIENDNKRADTQSILTLINQSKRNPEFGELVDKNDIDNDGIPDENLNQIYNNLEKINPQSSNFVTSSRGSTRVIMSVEEGASNREVLAAGEEISSSSRLNAVSTGGPIILREVSGFLIETTVNGLILSLILTTLFLSVAYKYIDGIATYGILNIIPVFVTVATIAATMRYLGITLNPITATTLSITVGIGTDYTIHMVHRITDEIEARDNIDIAIRKSVMGTGGALFGSMATTVFGIGSLTLSITPLLGQFGVIIAIGVFYSFIFSIMMIPPLFKIYHEGLIP